MTKTEYREYIGSDVWQKRRKEYLLAYCACNRCELPRWLAAIAYDQDLHVHHRSYANLSHEKDEDLEALCLRCHEIVTFGASTLREVKKLSCVRCGEYSWDRQGRLCGECRFVEEGAFCTGPFNLLAVNWTDGIEPVWMTLLSQIYSSLEYLSDRQTAEQTLLNAITALRAKSVRTEQRMRDWETKQTEK